jgi:hypothetical protein
MTRHPNPHLPYETWIPGAFYPFVPPDHPPAAAPVCRSTPYAGADGSTAFCTMGEWTGTPTSYAYQWKNDGTNIAGATAATYLPVAADRGHALTCVVTATNAIGATPAPPSNPVPVPADLVLMESDTVPGGYPAPSPEPENEGSSSPEPVPAPVDDPEDPKPKAAKRK